MISLNVLSSSSLKRPLRKLCTLPLKTNINDRVNSGATKKVAEIILLYLGHNQRLELMLCHLTKGKAEFNQHYFFKQIFWQEIIFFKSEPEKVANLKV